MRRLESIALVPRRIDMKPYIEQTLSKQSERIKFVTSTSHREKIPSISWILCKLPKNNSICDDLPSSYCLEDLIQAFQKATLYQNHSDATSILLLS